MRTKPITSFRGRYAFLSNFFTAPMTFDGVNYPTAEHAYQAQKCSESDFSMKYRISLCKTPMLAKRMGKKVKIREDWEEEKLEVMYEILLTKFSRTDLLKRLLKTGNAELIEDNYWHDEYWGVCNGVGENHLGKLLMKVRGELSGELIDEESDLHETMKRLEENFPSPKLTRGI